MERLTYDFCIGGNHCWQVKGADNLECREVCERQGDDGCKTCPIAKAFDRLAAIEDILGDEYELDAVAWVVRCKNCRYYRDAKINEKGFLICPASGMEITENDFCSYGESPKVAMKARELDEQYLL